MNKHRALFALSAVIFSAAVASRIMVGTTPSHNEAGLTLQESNHVFTWDCEVPTFKPKRIMIYCADGGAYIDQITWSSWGLAGASGTGDYYRNLCKPDCADGQIVHSPVKVSLTELAERGGRLYLRTLEMKSRDGKNFPWGEAGVFTWDLMEYIEHMNLDWQSD
jgi:hypothetical protein